LEWAAQLMCADPSLESIHVALSGPMGYAQNSLRPTCLCRGPAKWGRIDGGSMVQQLRLVVLLVGALIGGANAIQANSQAHQGQSPQDHVAWVAQALKRIQTIKPGTTREALLTVFTTEGGLYTGLQRTFVSRDCPFFKVDVEFQAVGRSNRDRNGRVTLVEGSQDIILKISRPYLQFSIVD